MQSGIGKAVRLEAWSVATIKNVMVDVLKLNNASAVLEVTVEVETSANGGASLEGLLVKAEIKDEFALVDDSEVKVPSDIVERTSQSIKLKVTVSKPKLWWVYTLGDPYLYEIVVTLVQGSEAHDEKRINYGIDTSVI
jgi:beta-galactosidase/beta-glucuronidase